MSRESMNWKRHAYGFRTVFVAALLAVTLSLPAQTGNKKAGGAYLTGKAGAPVKIEVFSDYQCPVCRTFYVESVKPLLADYAKANKLDKIAIVYYDMPLETIHPFARKAARFAQAALRLGKDKWLKVSDALYMQQTAWSENGNIEAILEKAVDPADFTQLKKLISDPGIDAAINEEAALGQTRNVTSTPTTFIIVETGRQQRANGIIPFNVLKDYVDKYTK
jgi:protein-disulfide isomerase